MDAAWFCDEPPCCGLHFAVGGSTLFARICTGTLHDDAGGVVWATGNMVAVVHMVPIGRGAALSIAADRCADVPGAQHPEVMLVGMLSRQRAGWLAHRASSACWAHLENWQWAHALGIICVMICCRASDVKAIRREAERVSISQ